MTATRGRGGCPRVPFEPAIAGSTAHGHGSVVRFVPICRCRKQLFVQLIVFGATNAGAGYTAISRRPPPAGSTSTNVGLGTATTVTAPRST